MIDNLFILIETVLCLMLLNLVPRIIAHTINPRAIPWRYYRPWSNLQPDQLTLNALAALLLRQHSACHAVASSQENHNPWSHLDHEGQLNFLSAAWLEVRLAMEGSRDFSFSSCRTWEDLVEGLMSVIAQHQTEPPATRLLLAITSVTTDHRRPCRERLTLLFREYRSLSTR